MRLYFSLFILVSLSLPIFAAQYYVDDTYNAEEIARGGVEGFSSSSQALWGNPANLKTIKNGSLAFYQSSFFDQDVKYNNLSIGFNLLHTKIGLGVFRAESADIPQNILDSNSEAKTVSVYDIQSAIYRVAIQKELTEWMSIGTTISKYTYRGFELTGDGLNMDFGALFTFKLNKLLDSISISSTLKNILKSDVSYSNGTSELLPSSLVLGGKAQVWDEFSLYFQKTILDSGTQLSGIGAVYKPYILYGQPISISVGHSDYQDFLSDKTTRSVFSLGVGLHVLNIDFYFAYQNDPSSYSEQQYFYTTNLNF